MNRAIIKAVCELETQLITGLITEDLYQKELDHLIEMVGDDEKTKLYIQYHKDRDI